MTIIDKKVRERMLAAVYWANHLPTWQFVVMYMMAAEELMRLRTPRGAADGIRQIAISLFACKDFNYYNLYLNTSNHSHLYCHNHFCMMDRKEGTEEWTRGPRFMKCCFSGNGGTGEVPGYGVVSDPRPQCVSRHWKAAVANFLGMVNFGSQVNLRAKNVRYHPSLKTPQIEKETPEVWFQHSIRVDPEEGAWHHNLALYYQSMAKSFNASTEFGRKKRDYYMQRSDEHLANATKNQHEFLRGCQAGVTMVQEKISTSVHKEMERSFAAPLCSNTYLRLRTSFYSHGAENSGQLEYFPISTDSLEDIITRVHIIELLPYRDYLPESGRLIVNDGSRLSYPNRIINVTVPDLVPNTY